MLSFENLDTLHTEKVILDARKELTTIPSTIFVNAHSAMNKSVFIGLVGQDMTPNEQNQCTVLIIHSKGGVLFNNGQLAITKVEKINV